MGYPKVVVKTQDGGLGFKADSKTGEALLVYLYADSNYPNNIHRIIEYNDSLFQTMQQNEEEYARDVEDFYAFEENRNTKIHFLAINLGDGFPVNNVLNLRVFNTSASSIFTTVILPLLLDNNDIRLMGVSRRYNIPTLTGQPSVDTDLETLIIDNAIQECLMSLFEKGMGVMCVLDNKTIGRGDSIAPSIVDLRGDNGSNSFFVVVCSCFIDKEDGEIGRQIVDLGAMLGKLASVPVHVNIGRVKDGALPLVRKGDRSVACLAQGTLEITKFNQFILETLHERCYNLYRKHIGKEGYYFTDGLTCASATSDYKDIANVRVVNEASRIVYKTYLERLLDNVAVDGAGRLPSIVVKTIENELLRAIESELGESISGARVTINPDQDIIGTGLLLVGLSIQPFGYAREIQVNVSLTKSL